ncbi:VOC family protein [Sphingobium sp. 15-1]|uniref:VOC family protein n=1 Tax=Sphingobium sp. 15-1 TaxID=2729616 RepID=UPI00159C296C|nr:VOC family protein [Sphingobium sp. 15-1]
MPTATKQTEDGRQERKIVPVRLAHFVIRTKNVRALIDWYKKVFHAEPIYDNGNLAFLYFDDEHHRIAIGKIPGLEEPNHKASGIDHVAFSYGSIEDLLHTYARLKEIDILPYWKIDHGLTTSLYYNDPDGNQIELQVDNFETLQEAHDYFRSDAFAKNPIGVEIDPDLLIARLQAGEAPHLLLSSGTRPA